jgi:nucleoid-associated protein YgaU
LEGWRRNGSKLKVMVTGTVINHDVYINDFTPQPKGGNGDYEYGISFIQAKDIAVYTVSELGMQPASPSNSGATATTRPAAPKKTAYTVVRGDCLWNIAKKFLGAGSRYMEIYNANKSVIGSNPSLIYAGQVFTIPQ